MISRSLLLPGSLVLVAASDVPRDYSSSTSNTDNMPLLYSVSGLDVAGASNASCEDITGISRGRC